MKTLPVLFIALVLMTSLPAADDAHTRKPLPSPEEISQLPPDGGEEFNRLVFEKSPYLLQHARNPVDWRPWGEEAFEEARKQDKPVFLSVGYTTCHWCHVMEHESFEDEDVAKKLNEYFIPVKVDREERPDIDEIYMTVTQALTGGGGWPMTVIMDAEQQPFFAGTYFPKDDRPGRIGIMNLMDQLHDAWTNRRDQVLASAAEISQHVQSQGSHDGDLPGMEVLDTAFEQLSSEYDPEHGGFGTAPKFPVPPNLTFLLRHHKRTGDPAALEMVERTIREMRMGGVYDQVGFGLHRYSTDREWLLPHFEKMLYDQALFAIALVETWEVTKNPDYAEIAAEIFTYVLRDMTSVTGGFYSAEDADSEGEEGTFYVWTPTEVKEVLGEDDGTLYSTIYNLEEGGNFVDEATRQKTGDSIPHLTKSVKDWAQELKMEPAALEARLEEMREKLFLLREERIHPQKDDKILTDWNGLMIAAFAKAAQVMPENREVYLNAATKAADFVLKELRTEEGRLLKRYRQGEAGLTAHLEDYVFMTWGLIELYEASFDPRYLREAIFLTDETITHFWDDEGSGAFLMTADDAEELLTRPKKLYGGAIPSGNAVAALNLARLYRMTANREYEDRLVALFKAFGALIPKRPSGFPQYLQAIEFQFGPSREIVLAGDLESPEFQEMLAAVRDPFLPNQVVLHRPAGEDPEIATMAAYTAAQKPRDGQPTAYVCENFTCNLPVTIISEVRELLGLEED